MIDVKLLDGVEPTRAKAGDAGLDLFSPESFTLRPGERRLQRCGFLVAVPWGTTGFVCPRSGNAWKKGIAVTNAPGVLDAGYRGELMVILWHTATHQTGCKLWENEPPRKLCSCGGNLTVVFNRGDAIGQLVVVKFEADAVRLVDELPGTERGASGIGSTDRAPYNPVSDAKKLG